jgi:hypothetical protein
MSTRIELEHKFLRDNNLPILTFDEIAGKADEIVEAGDEFLEPEHLHSSLGDVLGMLSDIDNCERALAIPSLTKDMLDRYEDSWICPKSEQLAFIFGDFPALAVCFPKYWARDGVPQELKKNLARLVMMEVMMKGMEELAAAEAGASEPAPAGFTREKAKPLKKTGGSARLKTTARKDTRDRPAAKD